MSLERLSGSSATVTERLSIGVIVSSELLALMSGNGAPPYRAVKPDNVATFIGKKLHSLYGDELGNNLNIRIEGSRNKHHMGFAAI